MALKAAGSITGVTQGLAANSIPIIGLSTGSIAAGGGISAITALPLIYPAAYCYFPANILAASIAAGFYYCTFSSTTAGTAFLNTLSTWPPTIPSSPTAVTAGQGAYTGDTAEEFLPSIAVPAMNAGSKLFFDQYMANNNSAGTKSGRMRWSTSGGTVLYLLAKTTQTSSHVSATVGNAGSTSSQNILNYSVDSAGTTANVAPALGTIASGVATTLVPSLQRNTATDNIILVDLTVGLAL
jgi:hypothetical protein